MARSWSAPSLARRLAAPEPSVVRIADVVVVGTGVAGLAAALAAAGAGRRVLVLTKSELGDGSTCCAQGGIAAALAGGDSPALHLRDTVDAGAGLCDEAAVHALVEQGPAALRKLAGLGAAFDLDHNEPGPAARTGVAQPSAAGRGTYALTREGGHSRPRIVHAGGDATGREVQRALGEAVRDADGIEVVERAFALDLLRGPTGAAGVTAGLLDQTGRVRHVEALRAPAVVLATGGFGQLYATTSNPDVATGDGLALALRAGAEVADVEFVQFHPTALFSPGSGKRLLVSEALRGEGATLVDAAGVPVMAGMHPLGDLASRDVVARAVATRLAAAPGGVSDHVYLDARALGEPVLQRRFPTIMAGCREAGIDPASDPIPVAPAAHYACGGVRVDRWGRTSVPGLYAVGEAASSGVHGANRLASNSLLEGLVMGEALAAALHVPGSAPSSVDAGTGRLGRPGLVAGSSRAELAAGMSRCAGVLRDAAGLVEAAALLERLGRGSVPGNPGGLADLPARTSWEATNLHAVATVLVAAATAREESRGCHVRLDHPDPRPEWRQRLVMSLAVTGELRERSAPCGRADVDVGGWPSGPDSPAWRAAAGR